jgi:DNA-binding protein HU-beta
MNKSDFIERVASKAELSKSAAARTVEAIFSSSAGVIIEALRQGSDVSLPGFGKFKSKVRAARKGRNPRTGKEIDIAQRTVMQFTAGKSVTDALAGGAAGRGAAKKSAGGAARGKSASKSAGKSAVKTAGVSASGSKSAAKGAGAKAAKSAGSKTSGAKSAAKSGRRS